MKFNKNLIVGNLFLILMFGGLTYLTFALPHASEEIVNHKNYNTLYIFFIIIDILVFLFVTASILSGDFYYKIVYIDANKFQIMEFENRTIIACDNWAWSFTDSKKKISKLKKIKTIHTYSIRKKFRGWQPLPFQS